MEDVLKMLDKLTREEAWMTTMEVLRATHAIDYRVRGIDARVHGIDDRVHGIDDRVHGIDDRVHAIDNKVQAVDELVVDDRAAGVEINVTKSIIGAQIVFNQAWEMFNLKCSDGKEAKHVTKKTASNVDQVKGSSSPELISTEY